MKQPDKTPDARKASRRYQTAKYPIGVLMNCVSIGKNRVSHKYPIGVLVAGGNEFILGVPRRKTRCCKIRPIMISPGRIENVQIE